jgi:hypothetical protein
MTEILFCKNKGCKPKAIFENGKPELSSFSKGPY